MTKQSELVVEKYKQHVQSPPQYFQPDVENPHRKLWLEVQEFMLGDPRHYHGRSFANSKLMAHSNITRWMAVTASLINALTAVPAFYFGFLNLGVFGLVLTGVLSGAAFKFSNDVAAAAAASTKGNRLWSNQGLIFFFAMHTVLTIISGVGSELLTNQTVLANRLATSKVDKLKPDFSRFDDAKTECNNLKNQFQQLSEGSPKRDYLLIQMKGEFSDWTKKWSVSDSNIPVCVLANLKDQDPDWSSFQKDQEERKKNGNDLTFLKKEYPDIYDQFFTGNGNIKSGSDAFSLAWDNFFGHVLSGQFNNMGQLGFALLIFSLSVVTSVGSSIALVTHTLRKDTQISHDPNVETAILEHFAYLDRAAQLQGYLHSEPLAEPKMTSKEINASAYPNEEQTKPRPEQSYEPISNVAQSRSQPEQSHEPQNSGISTKNKPRRGKYRRAID